MNFQASGSNSVSNKRFLTQEPFRFPLFLESLSKSETGLYKVCQVMLSQLKMLLLLLRLRDGLFILILKVKQISGSEIWGKN